MPSSFSWSRANSISLRLPSTSGIGKIAKLPNRPRWLLLSVAAYSLHSRASARAASLLPKCTPGSLTDTIEVATPPLSMSSTDFAGVHRSSGICPVFREEISLMKPGDEKWWCTSMRRGSLCAPAVPRLPKTPDRRCGGAAGNKAPPSRLETTDTQRAAADAAVEPFLSILEHDLLPEAFDFAPRHRNAWRAVRYLKDGAPRPKLTPFFGSERNRTRRRDAEWRKGEKFFIVT